MTKRKSTHSSSKTPPDGGPPGQQPDAELDLIAAPGIVLALRDIAFEISNLQPGGGGPPPAPVDLGPLIDAINANTAAVIEQATAVRDQTSAINNNTNHLDAHTEALDKNTAAIDGHAVALEDNTTAINGNTEALLKLVDAGGIPAPGKATKITMDEPELEP